MGFPVNKYYEILGAQFLQNTFVIIVIEILFPFIFNLKTSKNLLTIYHALIPILETEKSSVKTILTQLQLPWKYPKRGWKRRYETINQSCSRKHLCRNQPNYCKLWFPVELLPGGISWESSFTFNLKVWINWNIECSKFEWFLRY